MISLVYLASGFGRRFGSNKLLYKVNGKPMYEHTLASLLHLKSQDLRVIVVTQYEEIATYAREHGAEVVMNREAEEGISASIRLGVKQAGDSNWYAFFVADQPNLREDTITHFINESIHSGKTMSSVCTESVPGNPTMFHHVWREELLQLHGDVGGRKIMKKHVESVYWFDISEEERMDIDIPDSDGRILNKMT